MIYCIFVGTTETEAKLKTFKFKYDSALSAFNKLKCKFPYAALVQADKIGNSIQSSVLRAAENGEERECDGYKIPDFEVSDNVQQE